MAVGALLLLRRMYTGLILAGLALLAKLIVVDLEWFTAPYGQWWFPVLLRLFIIALIVRAFTALRDLRRRYS